MRCSDWPTWNWVWYPEFTWQRDKTNSTQWVLLLPYLCTPAHTYPWLKCKCKKYIFTRYYIKLPFISISMKQKYVLCLSMKPIPQDMLLYQSIDIQIFQNLRKNLQFKTLLFPSTWIRDSQAVSMLDSFTSYWSWDSTLEKYRQDYFFHLWSFKCLTFFPFSFLMAQSTSVTSFPHSLLSAIWASYDKL